MQANTTEVKKAERVEAPALDHDRMMLEKYKIAVIPRGKIERRVVANLLAHLWANGFQPVELNDGEEETKVEGPQNTMELMFNLDECRVYFSHASAPERLQWVFFVFGNDGWDCICDYSAPEDNYNNWNAVMDAFNPEDYA
jgi:hypothetical protein